MRVDKFIWAIRVIKTRSQAAKQCKEGKVSVDGVKVKPARIMKMGEVVVVRKGAVSFSYKVVDFPKSRVGAPLVKDFCLDVTSPEELEKLEMIKLTYKDNPKGVGRPTKRDRRNWLRDVRGLMSKK
ncbi:MAG TPA: RNA-binding S4 domain-containing protein [Flavobacteriales bacterium]|jgi:ribosome-associated heat shock protein Hsp15|nr:RNA-binding S4 domain-containing protein [Flavobacteriales bacterium]HIB78537.1 RNA-binding S4 domain-containing protein [Flavobacteriales bacterium]HIN41828.1 RNA-binding S4 domain-containing protein [Flavobacteriales bacterium]HIO16493.1 RNA-binding S4 domain-containing protein [Flavobacteriales bacterium]HIO59827.1 RNA-binding S4 domain-containing protein [Flavobacteriales bacterium]